MVQAAAGAGCWQRWAAAAGGSVEACVAAAADAVEAAFHQPAVAAALLPLLWRVALRRAPAPAAHRRHEASSQGALASRPVHAVKRA